MSDLIDIYEACGGVVSEDRSQVSMPQHPKPFDIVLRVVPQVIEMDERGGQKITFAVCLDDEFQIDGAMYYQVEHNAEVTLPVKQVKLLKKE